MPGTYVRKTNRAINEHQMKVAIKKCSRGDVPIREAARNHGLNRNTLMSRIRKVKQQDRQEKYLNSSDSGVSNDEEERIFHSKYAVIQVFSISEEDELVRYIKRSSDLNYGLSYRQIRPLAFEYASKIPSCKLPCSWKTNKIAGKDWLYGFMKRHNDLSLRKSESTSLARSSAFNKESVQDCQPIKYKRSIINSLVDRAILLSNTKFHNENLNLIKTSLNNKYLINFINNTIKNIFKYLNKNKVINTNSKEPCHFLKIPFNMDLERQTTKILILINITPAWYSIHSTEYLFSKLKDQNVVSLSSNFVYQVDCSNCNAIYIGESSQYIKRRYYQHEYNLSQGNHSHSMFNIHSIIYTPSNLINSTSSIFVSTNSKDYL